MSNWDRKISERTIEFTPREIYKLLCDIPQDIQAEIIIEVLCNEDYRINDAVVKWLEENGSGLTMRAADGTGVRRADENACQNAVDQMKQRLGPPRR